MRTTSAECLQAVPAMLPYMSSPIQEKGLQNAEEDEAYHSVHPGDVYVMQHQTLAMHLTTDNHHYQHRKTQHFRAGEADLQHDQQISIQAFICPNAGTETSPADHTLRLQECSN